MTTEEELDRLLARGGLSGPRHDRIFEGVYEQVRPKRRASSTNAVIGGSLALAAAAGAALLLLRPSSVSRDPYTPKGGRVSSVEVACSGGPLSACPRGSKLIFRFDALPLPKFVQAYAEPNEATGDRIWYFPTPANASPRLEASSEPRTLAQGIVIGPEHKTGRYRIHVALSATPLGREDVLRADGSPVGPVEEVDLQVVDP